MTGEKLSTFIVKFSGFHFLQTCQQSTSSTLGASNNAYERGQDPLDETLHQNTEHNITIVVENTTSIKDTKKKIQNDDHTLNFFLHNVESTISTKDLKLLDVNPLKNLRNSFRAKDSAKDHILVGFLRSFEFSEMGHETKKQVPHKSTEKKNRSREDQGNLKSPKDKGKLKSSEEKAAKFREEKIKPKRLEENTSFKVSEENVNVTCLGQDASKTIPEEKSNSNSSETKDTLKTPEEKINLKTSK